MAKSPIHHRICAGKASASGRVPLTDQRQQQNRQAKLPGIGQDHHAAHAKLITMRAFRMLPDIEATAMTANQSGKVPGPVKLLVEDALNRRQRGKQRGQRQGLKQGRDDDHPVPRQLPRGGGQSVARCSGRRASPGRVSGWRRPSHSMVTPEKAI
jgi:hypothetical protein